MLEPQVTLEPFEDPNTGGPDFRCVANGREQEFLVECTAIQVPTATKWTGLQDSLESGARAFGPLTPVLKEKLSAKSRQLAGAKSPLLLICATTHFGAGIAPLDAIFIEWLLVGQDHHRVLTGREEGGNWHSLYSMPSAVVMVGVGGTPCFPRGVVVPDAKLTFDPSLLPEWAFCRANPWPTSSDSVGIEWVMGNPSRVVDRDAAYRR